MTKNRKQYLGAAVLALALLAVTALAFTGHISAATAFNLTSGLGLVGVVTVTYKFPVAGTTPPTATQASGVQVVTALIEWAEADTIGLITHNLGLQTGTFPGNTSQLFPEVIWYPSFANTLPAAVAFALTSGNVITFGKTSAVGTAGSIVVIIRRPHSLGQ